MVNEKPIGKISHYYSKISVAVIDLTDKMAVGDSIHIKGHTTDFVQDISSIQLDHNQLEEADKGQAVGVKVNEPVRDGDVVYKATQ